MRQFDDVSTRLAKVVCFFQYSYMVSSWQDKKISSNQCGEKLLGETISKNQPKIRSSPLGMSDLFSKLHSHSFSEDSEAVIKMIMKCHRPQMRHESRNHSASSTWTQINKLRIFWQRNHSLMKHGCNLWSCCYVTRLILLRLKSPTRPSLQFFDFWPDHVKSKHLKGACRKRKCRRTSGGFLLLDVFPQGETASSEKGTPSGKSATDSESMNSSRRVTPHAKRKNPWNYLSSRPEKLTEQAVVQEQACHRNVYHLTENNYRFDVVQIHFFRINIKL